MQWASHDCFCCLGYDLWMDGVNCGVLEEHGYPEYPKSTLAGKSLALDETSTDAGQQTLLIGVIHTKKKCAHDWECPMQGFCHS